MALGTLGAALASTAVTAGANYGLGKLFGGKSGEAQAPINNFQPTGINAGGLKSSVEDGLLTVGSSGERSGLVRGIQDRFNEESGLLAGLRGRVAPGVSDLRSARLAEIENARRSAIGNLRENLQRRRVLGSSFGQDAAARAEAEFAGLRERTAAESFLQEIELTNQFINQEFNARRSAFQTGLDELNLQADIATKLSGQATQQLGANARALAELNAKEAAGAGSFLGQISQPVTSALGKAAGSMFSGGTNPLAGAFSFG